MIQKTIKIGDMVTISYESCWGRVLNSSSEARKIRHCNRKGDILVYKVLAIKCEIPIDSSTRTANTLIIQQDEDFTIAPLIAVNDCNLQHSIVGIGIQYIVAGKNVTKELSNQSKNAVLRAHLEGNDES